MSSTTTRYNVQPTAKPKGYSALVEALKAAGLEYREAVQPWVDYDDGQPTEVLRLTSRTFGRTYRASWWRVVNEFHYTEPPGFYNHPDTIDLAPTPEWKKLHFCMDTPDGEMCLGSVRDLIEAIGAP